VILPPLAAALWLLASQVPSDAGHTVTLPRVETEVTIDGRLDEPVWSRAAVLTGFTQYSPTDGIPARDTTQVLVWYSPTAIYFGIRAFEAHGSVHATLADRDHIFADDNIQLLLDPLRDGRQANLFAVNPLGVQGDGALVETGKTTNTGPGNTAIGGREAADLSPDYVYQSQGRVTDYGYEVEVRIPFKSLRFQPAKEQSWNFNVVRQVQHSGTEDTWAPARRARASFLAQSGALAGLRGLERGITLDLNPELTSRVDGGPSADGNWGYDAASPRVGGNVRWGVTNNLTLNATLKPDFSQVETDAGQLGFDPRAALFFPEKRPFFLDGIEQFSTPNQLIYTRRIVAPVTAFKLTGKTMGTNVGLLAAVDGRSVSRSGEDNAFIALLRPQRDFGRQLRVGLVYTDRIEASDRNQVLGVDGRYVFGEVYSAQFQLAGSRTRQGGQLATAPLWFASLERNGRTLGIRATTIASGDDFRAAGGFLARVGIVHNYIDPSISFYGPTERSLVQRITGDVLVDGIWQYQNFIHGGGIQDRKLHLSVNTMLRGGWQVGAGYFIETFGYDSALYAHYRLQVPRAGGGLDTIPFVGQPRIPNGEYFIQVYTPQFSHFDGNVFFLQGHDENFFEWSSSKLIIMTAELNWRPTEKLRFGLTYDWQDVKRRSDGSTVNVGRIPRLKVEYQISRPLFIRLVGQYTANSTDSLRDDSRTNAPILLVQGDTVVRASAVRSNDIRADLLLSYRPTPGTVIFAGYGSSLEEPEAFRFARMHRISDGFFVKLTYLLRL
jgi:Domain of unknown function (DUF5916)